MTYSRLFFFKVNLDQLSQNYLIIISSLLFWCITLSASFIRLLNIRCNYFIAAAIGHDLGSQIYKQNIYQSYEEFIQTPNSQRIQSLTVQVSGTIAAVNLLLQLITSLVVASLVLAMLLITNFSLTLSLTLSLTAIYGLIFTRVAGHVSNKGSQILTTGEEFLTLFKNQLDQ